MVLQFIYIEEPLGGPPPVTGFWLDYDGTLNDDSVDIVIAVDPPVRVDTNQRVDLWAGTNEVVAKVGNYLCFIDSSLSVTDFVDIDSILLWGGGLEVHRINLMKVGGSFFMLSTIDNGLLSRVNWFNIMEFTHSPGFGITVLNSTNVWTDGVSSASDVDVKEMQAVLLDPAGTVFVHYRGFSLENAVLIDSYFSATPVPSKTGAGASFSAGGITTPTGIPLLLTGSERGYLRFFSTTSTVQMVVAVSGSEVGLIPNFQDRIIVYVTERINISLGIDGMRPVDDIAGWLDLTSQLLLGTADPDGSDSGTLVPEILKIGTNLYVAINRKAAVLFEMNLGTGGGTVLDTLNFSATIFNSGAELRTANSVTRESSATEPPGGPANAVEIVANFDKFDALGAIAFRYFNVVVRVDTLLNVFEVTVNGPIQVDQNISSGPAYVDGWFENVDADEIWNIWGAQSGADLLLKGMKIKR